VVKTVPRKGNYVAEVFARKGISWLADFAQGLFSLASEWMSKLALQRE